MLSRAVSLWAPNPVSLCLYVYPLFLFFLSVWNGCCVSVRVRVWAVLAVGAQRTRPGSGTGEQVRRALVRGPRHRRRLLLVRPAPSPEPPLSLSPRPLPHASCLLPLAPPKRRGRGGENGWAVYGRHLHLRPMEGCARCKCMQAYARCRERGREGGGREREGGRERARARAREREGQQQAAALMGLRTSAGRNIVASTRRFGHTHTYTHKQRERERERERERDDWPAHAMHSTCRLCIRTIEQSLRQVGCVRYAQPRLGSRRSQVRLRCMPMHLTLGDAWNACYAKCARYAQPTLAYARQQKHAYVMPSLR
jgi:hypothetical protein